MVLKGKGAVSENALVRTAMFHGLAPGPHAAVAAEMPETAHTWQGRVPQRAMRGRLAVQVAANSPNTAHTWQRRASAMSPWRSCGGGPHRAVQNQASCCTGRPRWTVRYRKRPCGVREAHLSSGAARGGGSSTGRHVERMTGASGSRWRIVVAQVRRKSMRAMRRAQGKTSVLPRDRYPCPHVM